MADKTVKNLFDDGYTTYHDDGTTSKTYKNPFGDGYTTYHSDGSTSKTYDKVFSDGKTTYHSDGSKSDTYKNAFSDGYTTYHSDGSKSKTYKSTFGDGYTTYTSGKPSGSGGYSGGGGGYSGGGSYSSGGGYSIEGVTSIFGIALLVLSFFLSFSVPNSILYFVLIIATIVPRIWLNKKYDTTLFTLWFYPLSLLVWKWMADSFWMLAVSVDFGESMLPGIGTYLVLFALWLTLFMDCDDNIIEATYCGMASFGMIYFEGMIQYLGENPIYMLLGGMLLVALVFTPSLIKKITKA